MLPIVPTMRVAPIPADALHLHISRRARSRFGLDEALFGLSGRVLLADADGARALAEKLYGHLAEADPALAGAITPGRLFAMGLVHELLHSIIARYLEVIDDHAFTRALSWLEQQLGDDRLERTLVAFAREFPPLAVWRHELSLEEFLAGETAGRPNREVLLEEMLLLWLVNASPAFAPFRELFDDSPLRRDTAYPEIAASLETFFAAEPPMPRSDPGAPEQSLFEALRAPAVAAPDSLADQLLALEQLRAPAATPHEDTRFLRAVDLAREAEHQPLPPGPGPVQVAVRETAARTRQEREAEEREADAAVLAGPRRFSPDREWMPRLVLVAKNVLVWCVQLSRQYGRSIRRLDEIPEAELETLAERGFTGLWLIGLWSRSPASQRIKALCGNPDAAASAYSLASYEIADELGGEAALLELSNRAQRVGIRLACDMVPNHLGIDSRWMIEHPERFLQLPHSPFPAYSFRGPDLSPDPEVGLYLEDHYYDKTDAAVVFQRVDRRTGEIAYVYHGNDGTSTPWNDTAQLDYLKDEVREAVLELILEVARRFPIIRFDAAMTLARQHFHRLWYPAPGSAQATVGGKAVPSRIERGLTRIEFDQAMPEEFWRHVVDRVAAEVPDTLLLAEAFWLMENYFVRSLGMHRVYNSAFMNLLRDEKNAKYRRLLRSILAREPEILSRYVNFMNNPDERTALDQFGAGDKYFGVCTLMTTLPGLPMFGHGQIEGFGERYGMEFVRPQLDEKLDAYLVSRHEREIFPLLVRRTLFASAANFRLLDFERADGTVDEDVFAFTNREGEEHALVVVHNRGGATQGRLRRSVPFAISIPVGNKRPIRGRQTLGQALGFRRDREPLPSIEKPRSLVRCRDLTSGLEFLWDVREIVERGLTMTLGPYEHHAFVDFQTLDAPDERWLRLAESLAGHGVPSLDEARLEPELEGVLGPFRDLFGRELLYRWLAALARDDADRAEPPELLDEVLARWSAVEQALVAHASPADGVTTDAARAHRSTEVRSSLAAALRLPKELRSGVDLHFELPLLAWCLLHPWSEVGSLRAWLDDLLLGRQLERAFAAAGRTTEEAHADVLLVAIAASEDSEPPPSGFLFEDADVRALVGVHRFIGVEWFKKEPFDRLLAWGVLLTALETGAESEATDEAKEIAAELARRAEAAGWRVESMRVPAEPASAEESSEPGSPEPEPLEPELLE